MHPLASFVSDTGFADARQSDCRRRGCYGRGTQVWRQEPPGIEEQTDWAVKALAEKGFSNVERKMLPGVGHSPLASEVWKFVDEVVDAR